MEKSINSIFKHLYKLKVSVRDRFVYDTLKVPYVNNLHREGKGVDQISR